MMPVIDGEHILFNQRQVETNEEGLLEIDGILPGLEYYLRRMEDGVFTFSEYYVLIPET